MIGGSRPALEAVEAALARCERLNPELNAYLHLDPEGALAAAVEALTEPVPPPPTGR
jgi:Asp-tRNA(Asn)/Glu-tRNA(Gln) amidotransferase A subunit family amidase